MKALFLTYPHLGLAPGGMGIQINSTAQGLRDLGVEVLYLDPWRNQINDVDVVHFFSIHGSMETHVLSAAAQGTPVIASPVFNCFAEPAIRVVLKSRLAGRLPGFYTEFGRSRNMLRKSFRVLCQTEDERRLLMRSFSLPGDRCVIVPNGTEKRFAAGDPSLFEKRFGVRDVVLEVGSIERRKNQLNLIRAMKDLPYTLVLIGEARLAGDYLRQCKHEAGPKVIFVGQLDYDDPLLASAYAAAKVCILPSYTETWGLVLYEGALTGCRLIASSHVPIPPEISAHVVQVDPDRPDQMAAAITRAMQQARDEQAQRIVRDMPSWADVARQIQGIYYAALTTRR